MDIQISRKSLTFVGYKPASYYTPPLLHGDYPLLSTLPIAIKKIRRGSTRINVEPIEAIKKNHDRF